MSIIIVQSSCRLDKHKFIVLQKLNNQDNLTCLGYNLGTSIAICCQRFVFIASQQFQARTLLSFNLGPMTDQDWRQTDKARRTDRQTDWLTDKLWCSLLGELGNHVMTSTVDATSRRRLRLSSLWSKTLARPQIPITRDPTTRWLLRSASILGRFSTLCGPYVGQMANRILRNSDSNW